MVYLGTNDLGMLLEIPAKLSLFIELAMLFRPGTHVLVWNTCFIFDKLL